VIFYLAVGVEGWGCEEADLKNFYRALPLDIYLEHWVSWLQPTPSSMSEAGEAERSTVIAGRILRYPKQSVFLVVVVLLGLGSSYHGLEVQSDTPAHVCVVGAGIAGAAAVHHINRATRITVFEASDRAGGRIQTVELAAGVTAEAGASIIASENRLMGSYADLLNLPHAERDSGKLRTMGLWDGAGLRFLTSGRGWVDAVLMLLRYGRDVLLMRSYITRLLQVFESLYTDADVGYPSVQSYLERAHGLYELTQHSFNETVSSNFSQLLAEEYISAVTRVNYNQDVEQMNGLSGAVALAGTGKGLWCVAGGNALIVAGLLERSNATVLLNSRVTSITFNEETGKYTLHGIFPDVEIPHDDCDVVVLALPLELSGIDLSTIDEKASWDVGRQYMLTVTTFVRGLLRASYFGSSRAAMDDVGVILTTAHADAPFSSIGRVARRSGHNNTVDSFYKIFSRSILEPSTLQSVFEDDFEVLARYDWRAYPSFNPPERFASFQLGGESHRIFYTGPIESASSAMEMSALSGRNIAALVNQAVGLSGPTQPPSIVERSEL
jgi:prenylcysteine oxidase / farnesylcysteine lyase